jgi:glycosyltransferase involved in cell wall biosynthesis
MAPSRRRCLYLEPFFGGSHREFAEGWIEHSRHEIELHSLPARFWKWRMRGAALHFAQAVPDPSLFDALITTDMLSLADLKALWGRSCPPCLVYFHENQLTYPLAAASRVDLQYGFTNLTTALSADRVLFNSQSHYEAFFAALPQFLRRMPEFRPHWAIETIRARSAVRYPGCRLPSAPEGRPEAIPLPPLGEIPLVVWNHRWEFDKRPDVFFSVLAEVEARGVEFRLALLGENYQKVPKEFIAARERWPGRVVQYGFLAERSAYLDWLRRGAVVVSTAAQENFGVSVVEAVRLGCFPLLPRRLSYPELLPAGFHPHCLYSSEADLADRLETVLRALPQAGSPYRDRLRELALSMDRFSWERAIGDFDGELDALGAPRAPHR